MLYLEILELFLTWEVSGKLQSWMGEDHMLLNDWWTICYFVFPVCCLATYHEREHCHFLFMSWFVLVVDREYRNTLKDHYFRSLSNALVMAFHALLCAMFSISGGCRRETVNAKRNQNNVFVMFSFLFPITMNMKEFFQLWDVTKDPRQVFPIPFHLFLYNRFHRRRDIGPSFILKTETSTRNSHLHSPLWLSHRSLFSFRYFP